MMAKFGMLEYTHGVRLPVHAKFPLDQFILSPSSGKNPNFAVFWTLAFCDVAN